MTAKLDDDFEIASYVFGPNRTIDNRAEPAGEDDPSPNALLPIVRRTVEEFYLGEFEHILGRLTEDCIMIGASSDVYFGLEEILSGIEHEEAFPHFSMKDFEGRIIKTSCPNEVVAVCFYTLYSDLSHGMLVAERQRLTVNARLEDGIWKYYLIHSSNEWGSRDESGALFPLEVSRETFKYVQGILSAARFAAGGQRSVMIGDSRGMRVVVPSRLVWIEAEAKRTVLHYVGEDDELKAMFSDVLAQLPSNFIRIHRSYAVNRDYVKSFDGAEVLLLNGMRLAVPKGRRNEVALALAESIGEAGSTEEMGTGGGDADFPVEQAEID